ncbi:late expression factor 5 [Apocheima cinerarium nucleopolyhedrovirus]|uniref:late expression factor 5 n=1 Tax=Apocheima cinerarium nucleopolyhedrovirus TaxID=307461 RepID=UPI0001D92098|nr:late expression factor 5 [Apocheima cinerarium nucleopolyhedrovirus]ADB84426.1 late expression factor 5 [Apocheima cinerarium nucleopolyhedrovirus]
MVEEKFAQIRVSVDDQQMSLDKSSFETEHSPPALHCYDLFLIFKKFRENNQYKELIDFLTENYPANVKNKTFNFVNTKHLFHSLYAYIPAITNVEKERKQIRLSEECIRKLCVATTNDFKLYSELFDIIRKNNTQEECPCQLLLKNLNKIKQYVSMRNNTQFDKKPPKFKKELIDSIMNKYQLYWINFFLKLKGDVNNKIVKKKRKTKERTILTDDYIYFENNNVDYSKKLSDINGMSLCICKHKWKTIEKQLRAGDEAVSFIIFCEKCSQVKQN